MKNNKKSLKTSLNCNRYKKRMDNHKRDDTWNNKAQLTILIILAIGFTLYGLGVFKNDKDDKDDDDRGPGIFYGGTEATETALIQDESLTDDEFFEEFEAGTPGGVSTVYGN